MRTLPSTPLELNEAGGTIHNLNLTRNLNLQISGTGHWSLGIVVNAASAAFLDRSSRGNEAQFSAIAPDVFKG